MVNRLLLQLLDGFLDGRLVDFLRPLRSILLLTLIHLRVDCVHVFVLESKLVLVDYLLLNGSTLIVHQQVFVGVPYLFDFGVWIQILAKLKKRNYSIVEMRNVWFSWILKKIEKSKPILHLIVLKNPEGHICLEKLEEEVRRISILLNVVICALGGHVVQRHIFATRLRLHWILHSCSGHCLSFESKKIMKWVIII